MTTKEKMRLNEILFCNLFRGLMKQHKNPITVINFMTSLGEVVGANTAVINSIITTILNNDRRYMPKRWEYGQLLHKQGVPVREIIDTLHMSFSTFYSKNRADILIEPRYDPIQYAEMMKILIFFEDTHKSLEGGALHEYNF